MRLIQTSLNPSFLIAGVVLFLGVGCNVCSVYGLSSPPLLSSSSSASSSLLDPIWTRGDFLHTMPSATLLVSSLLAPSTQSVPSRAVVDVGSGVDLLSGSPRLTKPDAFFPVSMEGLWECQRVVDRVEGDVFQATAVWKALGGINLSTTTAAATSGSTTTTNTPMTETYATRFLPSPYSGDLSGYTVLDRGYDYASRGIANAATSSSIVSTSSSKSIQVNWDVKTPDHLETSQVKLDVVWRIVEIPNEQGFGAQELFKIATTTDGSVLRAALVKRRFRRNFDAQQNRVVEGVELIKTFRVLDGVAGTEMPTSVIRSQIRLTRPRGDALDVPSGAY